MSARLSTRLPLACSGGIYAAVPNITPATVAPIVRVGESFSLCFTRLRTERLRQSKIQQFHRAIRRDLHIGWFQIPMHDAALVRILQRIRDLDGDVPGLLGGQGT